MKRHQFKLVVIISFILIWFSGTAWAGDRRGSPRHPKQTRQETIHHQQQGPGTHHRSPSVHTRPSARRAYPPARPHQYRHDYYRYRHLPTCHNDCHIHVAPLPALILTSALIFSIGMQ